MARVKLCAIARNEGAYLADWVFHHLHFGFDAIEVWVNGTEDPSLSILRRIGQEYPQVTGRRADRLLAECLAQRDSFQRRAYTRLASKARREGFSHVAFLDLDEYWLPLDARSSVHDFLPHEQGVNVVSFPWCFDVPQPDRKPFAPVLARPVLLQVERYVKSVVRLDGSVRAFREHTAWTDSGTRLLVREPFPLVDGRAQGGGSVIPREILEDRWDRLPEAFVLHAVNRSPREFVANLAKGARQTGVDTELKPNRYRDSPTDAPVLVYAPRRRARWDYERSRRRFHRRVAADPLIRRSQELMEARAASLLARATTDEQLRPRLRRALHGIPPRAVDGLHPGWDTGLRWVVDAVADVGGRARVLGWAFGVSTRAGDEPGLEFALRDGDGVIWSHPSVEFVPRPDVLAEYSDAPLKSGFVIEVPRQLEPEVDGLHVMVRVRGAATWEQTALSGFNPPTPRAHR